jgi:hypothetical protein
MAPSGNDNIIIISAVFSLLAIVAVVLRFYARHARHVPFGADDYVILPAVVRRSIRVWGMNNES